jgi:predicted dehydrogenase
MVMELGVGIVGYGFIGKVQTYAYRSLPMFYDVLPFKARLVGVCDVNRKAAEQGMEQAEFQCCATDYHELLKRKDIQVVHCCTPNIHHKELLIAAAEAGKHIYCDKPLAINAPEAREVLAAVRKAGVKHQMGVEYRFIPAVLRARQLIDEGFLGRVFSFRCQYLHASYIDPNRPLSWRLDRKVAGGGALLDMGPHPIDMILYLLGDYAGVMALTETCIKDRPVVDESGRRAAVEVDDIALLQVRLKNGAVGTIEASRLATGANDELRFDIHGSQGAISFNCMDPNWLSAYDCRDADAPIGGRRGFKKIETVQRYPPPATLPVPKQAIGWMRYHVASVCDFLLHIAQDTPTCPSFEEGARVNEIIDAAYRSSTEGRWIDL